MSIDLKIQEKSPGVFILFPKGDLNATTSPRVQQKINELTEMASTSQIVLDLKDLEFISSHGIRVFVVATKAMKAKGGKIAIVNPQPQIKKVFEIINAIPSLEIFANQAELDNYLLLMQKKIIGEGEDT